MSAKIKICVVAFSDTEGRSIAYKKFDDVGSAVDFYRQQLEKDNVNVISTRKTKCVSKGKRGR